MNMISYDIGESKRDLLLPNNLMGTKHADVRFAARGSSEATVHTIVPMQDTAMCGCFAVLVGCCSCSRS